MKKYSFKKTGKFKRAVMDDEGTVLGELSLDEGGAVLDDEELEELIEKRGKKMTEMPAAEAALLCEAFNDGKVDRRKAAALCDEGKLKPGAIFRAQEAEALVERLISEGRVLPKKRATAFRLALGESDAMASLLSDVKPAADTKAYGHSAGGEMSAPSEELNQLVEQQMKEKKTDYSTALGEVTRENPGLWRRASREIERAAHVGADTEPGEERE